VTGAEGTVPLGTGAIWFGCRERESVKWERESRNEKCVWYVLKQRRSRFEKGLEYTYPPLLVSECKPHCPCATLAKSSLNFGDTILILFNYLKLRFLLTREGKKYRK